MSGLCRSRGCVVHPAEKILVSEKDQMDASGTEFNPCSPHPVNVPDRCAPVAFCSRPVSAHKGTAQSRESEKRELAADLLAGLPEEWPDRRIRGLGKIRSSIRLTVDRLGRPGLVINRSHVVPVSFTRCLGRIWAAVAVKGCSVGIDSADAEEFHGAYPFDRAFRKGELGLVAENLPLCGKADSAALVWSAKEAVVKALGCGFHLVDPLEIEIVDAGRDADGILLTVTVPERTWLRGSMGKEIEVRSMRDHGAWLSTALDSLPRCFSDVPDPV